MLFDVVPKEEKKDLYDRERELEEIYEASRLGERLIVIYGIRRIGKSSLVRVALKELRVPYLIIDVRNIFFSENSVSMPSLIKYLMDGFKKHMNVYEKLDFSLKEILRRFRKIHVKDYEIEIEPNAKIGLSEILMEINNWCAKHDTRFFLVFDEAQYLRFSNVRYDGLLAWSIDNMKNVTFILTGSEVGVLKEFLKVNKPESPLYGRYRREIYLDRFSKEQSITYLVNGFLEQGVKPNIEEFSKVVDVLDGIVGWLTYYGYYRTVRGLSHNEALKILFEEGSKLVLNELERLIYPARNRYLAILKAVANNIGSWSEIKRYVAVRTGYVNERRYTELLKNLIKYGYLMKDNDQYKIPDPIVKYLVLEVL